MGLRVLLMKEEERGDAVENLIWMVSTILLVVQHIVTESPLLLVVLDQAQTVDQLLLVSTRAQDRHHQRRKHFLKQNNQMFLLSVEITLRKMTLMLVPLQN